MSVQGQKAKYSMRADVFRSTPESGPQLALFPPPGGETPANAIFNAIAAGSQHKDHQEYQPPHGRFGIGTDHDREILDRSRRGIDARCFGSQSRALGLHLNQRCGGRPPLDAKVVARLALLIGQVHRTNHPAAAGRLLHGSVNLRNRVIQVRYDLD
jgi:hypothetical protein